MNCKQCTLRFNTTTRKPLTSLCGHTYCGQCRKKLMECPTCQKVIDKTKFNINDSVYQMLQQKPEMKDIDQLIKVCFVGGWGVGKTSIIKGLRGQKFNTNLVTTVGIDFFTIMRTIDIYNVKLQIWDTTGQQRFRCLATSQLKNANIVIIVYDVNQKIEQNQKLIFDMEKLIDQNCPQGVRRMLVGNKIDMQSTTNIEQSLSLQDETNCHCEVSCKTNEGIEELWSRIEYNSLVAMNKVGKNYLTPSKRKSSRETDITSNNQESNKPANSNNTSQKIQRGSLKLKGGNTANKKKSCC